MRTARTPFASLAAAAFLLLGAGMAHATECVAVRVKPIRHICGVVYDPTHEPIPNAKVTIIKDGHELSSVQSDGDGKFTFGQLDAANYVVRVQAQGFLTAEALVVVVRPTAKCKRGLEVVLELGLGCSSISRAKQ